jgi:hypothetical protein
MMKVPLCPREMALTDNERMKSNPLYVFEEMMMCGKKVMK